jgi:hypothetical protein
MASKDASSSSSNGGGGELSRLGITAELAGAALQQARQLLRDTGGGGDSGSGSTSSSIVTLPMRGEVSVAETGMGYPSSDKDALRGDGMTWLDDAGQVQVFGFVPKSVMPAWKLNEPVSLSRAVKSVIPLWLVLAAVAALLLLIASCLGCWLVALARRKKEEEEGEGEEDERRGGGRRRKGVPVGRPVSGARHKGRDPNHHRHQDHHNKPPVRSKPHVPSSVSHEGAEAPHVNVEGGGGGRPASSGWWGGIGSSDAAPHSTAPSQGSGPPASRRNLRAVTPEGGRQAW